MNDSIHRRKGQLLKFELIDGDWTLKPEKIILKDYVLSAFKLINYFVIVMPEAFSYFNVEFEHEADIEASYMQAGISIVHFRCEDGEVPTVLAKIQSMHEVEDM